jgi:hypothetical protein
LWTWTNCLQNTDVSLLELEIKEVGKDKKKRLDHRTDEFN